MIACLDLEGVLVPEIWIAFAEKTGLEELRLTTRDIPDYVELMNGRLRILDKHNLKLDDIQEVIRSIKPIDGANDFLSRLREDFQIIILSDTFEEFAAPLMAKLGYPTLFCNSLMITPDNRISNYSLRQPDGKTKAITALKSLNFKIIASGDSYNDTGMLKEAHAGIFFRPPDAITQKFPQFPVTQDYDSLLENFLRFKRELEID